MENYDHNVIRINEGEGGTTIGGYNSGVIGVANVSDYLLHEGQESYKDLHGEYSTAIRKLLNKWVRWLQLKDP